MEMHVPEASYWSQRLRTPLARRRLLGASLATFATAGWAVACAGSKRAGGRASATTGQAGKPRQGGTFSVGQGIDPYDYDPSTQSQNNGFVLALAYDALLDEKTGAGVGFTDVIVQPGLADKWEMPDPQTYTFHLHPGARFANLPPVNGRAVTSADVKFSYEYLSRTGEFQHTKLPSSIAADYFSGLDRLETPDAQTIVTHFQTPFAPFLNYMSMREWNPIVPHEIYDQDGNFHKRIAGTGPWQLDLSASQQGSHWVLKRNPTYFKEGLPYLDAVQYLIQTDDASQYAAFAAQQTDVLRHDVIPVNVVPEIKREAPKAVSSTFLSNAGGHLFENVRKPPLNDIRVRRAIALSIDRNAFLKAFSGGQGEWATAGGVQGLFTQQELEKMLPYDPAQAKQLLSTAGYVNGLDLELMYPGAARGQLVINIDQLIQQQLKQSGINIALKNLDVATYSARVRSGNYQLDWESKAVEGDADFYTYRVFYSKSLANYGGINDPELDKLLIAQRQELDPAKRKQLLRQAVQRIADQAWSVGFYYGQAYTFMQPYVRNCAENAALDLVPPFVTWLDK
jgi:peptide/nickel transport system substrate-binding protein